MTNLTEHKCKNKCPEFKGEQCNHCLVQGENVVLFSNGDYVVFIGNKFKDVLLEVVKPSSDPELIYTKIVKTGQCGPVFKADIRHAKPEEIQANCRLTTSNTRTLEDMGDDRHIENHISNNCQVFSCDESVHLSRAFEAMGEVS
ncbi:hypothetical protein [Acinetobacter baumannii]